MWRILGALALVVGLAVTTTADAGQTAIGDYDVARDRFFWAQLYTVGGEELYCAPAFGPGERVVGKNLSVEHAYSVAAQNRMRTAL